ncbi:hypothetical protein ACIQ4I_07065 [Rummeliibacillus sp. NPDC094406]|uniref:hypothetical protein n=1 Tax=Rummeliibacillus sp. NPDC094406 TaxID=3364511 RepID=UPI003808CD29
MSNRSQMSKAVRKARSSMLFEYFFKYSQRMIAYALLFAFVIMLVSRFFVLPFYKEIALGIAAITLFIAAIYLWWKRPSKKQSLNALDNYFPDNLLRTVYSIEDLESHLAKQLVILTEKIAPHALVNYQKRKKSLWLTNTLIGSITIILGIALLSLFPSTAQQTANNVKEEKLMTAEVKKAVENMKKKAETKETKKAIEELQNELKKAKTTETALQAVVKKQKELELQKQKLEDKKAANGESLSKEEQHQLRDLQQATASLSKKALQTQNALSNSGTPISPNLQIALNQSAQSNQSMVQNSSSPTQLNSNNPANNSQNPAQNNSSSSSQGNSQGSANNQGQSQGQGKSNGNKSTGGSGSGSNKQGNGAGNGSGNGRGSGYGPSAGAGIGTGNRSLVAVPKRIGEKGKTTTDAGKLKDGDPTSIQESNNGKIAKGSVRSYKEVTDNYKKSYMQTTERLQLPGELNQIVQKYFSSVEE